MHGAQLAGVQHGGGVALNVAMGIVPIMPAGWGGLQVVAKAHKALMKDKTLGEGTVDLAAAARSTGLTTVPLTSVLKGGHAGQVPPPLPPFPGAPELCPPHPATP